MRYLMIPTLLLLFASCAATAGDSRGYLGGAIGRIDFDARYTSEPTLTHEKIDSNAGVVAVYGGFDYNRYWSLELIARDSGAMSSDQHYHDASLQQFAVMPTLKWEIHPLVTLFLQAGPTSAHYTMTLDSAPYYHDLYHWYGTGYMVQTGANISFNRHLKMRLGYDYTAVKLRVYDILTENLWKPEPPELDAHWGTSTLGIHYQF